MVIFCIALLETSGFWDVVGINAVGGMAVTMWEKLTQVLNDGQWHSTTELVEQVGAPVFDDVASGGEGTGVAGGEAAL